MQIELRPPKAILLPVDCSRASGAAARCADLVAKHFEAGILLLHVVEPAGHPIEMLGGGFDRRPRSERALEDVTAFALREFPDRQPEVRVEEGEPANVILRVAEQTRADLIVMPTRGKGAFRRFLLGSVTAKVLNDSSVPVLTAAHGEESDQVCVPTGIKRVLAAAALDGRSEAACRAAVLLASAYGASLALIHVLEGGASKEGSTRRLQELAERTGAEAELHVESGHPDRVISAFARTSGADIVVIGRSSPGPLGRLRAQSYGIIRESPCPVLSV